MQYAITRPEAISKEKLPQCRSQLLLDQFIATTRSLRPLAKDKLQRDHIDQLKERLNTEGLSPSTRSAAIKLFNKLILSKD